MSTQEASSDFEIAQREWTRIPLDDIGYFAASDLLAMPDKEFLELLSRAERNRYTGWRNHQNLWYRHLIEGVKGKLVLDFGCGVGIEALQFAAQNNRIVPADINVDSVKVACRLLRLHGYAGAIAPRPISGEYPFVEVPRCDVFYSNGVLHHTPAMPRILERARELIGKTGEIRLMLYTDEAWRQVTGVEPPPASEDPREHPQFSQFVIAMDGVGEYAEPWWESKLREVARNRNLLLRQWTYLTPQRHYAAALLEAM